MGGHDRGHPGERAGVTPIPRVTTPPPVKWVGATMPVFGWPERLSDEDVERIAKRVAELLREAK